MAYVPKSRRGQQRRHNKLVSIKRGELKDIEQVTIVDEASYRRELESYIGSKISGRLIDWLRKEQGFTCLGFTTTIGDPDPDHINWYAVIDTEANVLILVNRQP